MASGAEEHGGAEDGVLAAALFLIALSWFLLRHFLFFGLNVWRICSISRLLKQIQVRLSILSHLLDILVCFWKIVKF